MSFDAAGYTGKDDQMLHQILFSQQKSEEGQDFDNSFSHAKSIGGIHPLSREEVRGAIQGAIVDAVGVYGSSVHEQRRVNIRRYHGKPIGNEVEGQSQAQTSTVADTIEWIQPGVIRAFFGGNDNFWDFHPTRPGEEPMSQQASDVINHIWLNECNGFQVFNEWTKTANMEKRGYIAAYYEERFEPKKETYRGIGEQQLGVIVSDPNVELIEFGPHEGEILLDQMGTPTETFDVTVQRVTKIGRIRIDAIPPEHMLLARSETAEISDETLFVGYRKRMMISELISLGYDPDIVTALPRDTNAEFAEGRVDRLYDENSFPTNLEARGQGASRQIWVNFIWMRLDEDGDGYAELRHIVCVGDSSVEIISDREVNHTNIVSICPIPMPHKFQGMCPADQAADLQVITSTLLRQQLDNQYRLNYGRYEVVEGQVNTDDLIDVRPGGAVRVTGLGMIKGLDTPPLPPHSFELMNWMESMGEKRTGVSSWQQGPDAADMKYQTSGAVSNVSTASEQRVNLINTNFAQTGVKALGKLLLRLVCENYMAPFVVRLRGQWVECDPRSWNANMDCTVTTGKGVGESEAKLQRLFGIAGLQETMLKNGMGGIVTPKNIYNTMRDIIKAAGLGQEGYHFTDPGDEPWPEPQPDFTEQVKFRESDRRALEDQSVDNQATMSLAVQASQQEDIAKFRYVELESKAEIEGARLANQREIARLQYQAQIQASMSHHNN